MKINSSTDRFSTDSVTGKKTANAGSSTTSKSGSKGDATKVDVSSLGGTLASLQTELAEPAVDTAKVDEVKDAIRKGQFQVNSGAVADKLIASVQDLLAGKSNH
jgi:negative regulator of flagellin synthesis FlgM